MLHILVTLFTFHPFHWIVAIARNAQKGSSLVVGGDATEGCSGVCDSQSHGEGLLAAPVHFMKLERRCKRGCLGSKQDYCI